MKHLKILKHLKIKYQMVRYDHRRAETITVTRSITLPFDGLIALEILDGITTGASYKLLICTLDKICTLQGYNFVGILQITVPRNGR